MEEMIKSEYAIYLFQNMFKDPDSYIDFQLLTYEEFKRQLFEAGVIM